MVPQGEHDNLILDNRLFAGGNLHNGSPAPPFYDRLRCSFSACSRCSSRMCGSRPGRRTHENLTGRSGDGAADDRRRQPAASILAMSSPHRRCVKLPVVGVFASCWSILHDRQRARGRQTPVLSAIEVNEPILSVKITGPGTCHLFRPARRDEGRHHSGQRRSSGRGRLRLCPRLPRSTSR